MFKFNLDDGVVIKLAVNKDGERVRIVCSCEEGKRGVPCEHIDLLFQDWDPELADDTSAAKEGALDAAHGLIGESPVEELAGLFDEFAGATLEIEGHEEDRERIRAHSDAQERRWWMEEWREELPGFKEGLKEAKAELSTGAKSLLRKMHGLGASGRAKKSGWGDEVAEHMLAAEEFRALSKGFVDELFERAAKEGRETAEQNVPTPSAPEKKPGGGRARSRSGGKRGQEAKNTVAGCGCLLAGLLIIGSLGGGDSDQENEADDVQAAAPAETPAPTNQPEAKKGGSDIFLAWEHCKSLVVKNLKSPDDALWPTDGLMTGDLVDRYVASSGENKYIVAAWVDVPNYFGAAIRITFQCRMQFYPAEKIWRMSEFSTK